MILTVIRHNSNDTASKRKPRATTEELAPPPGSTADHPSVFPSHLAYNAYMHTIQWSRSQWVPSPAAPGYLALAITERNRHPTPVRLAVRKNNKYVAA